MVKIIQTDKITKGEVIQWIKKCTCWHSLQSIRAKTNKRIKSITSPKEKSPFAHIPIEQKREVLKDLLVDAPDLNSKGASQLKGDGSEDFKCPCCGNYRKEIICKHCNQPEYLHNGSAKVCRKDWKNPKITFFEMTSD